MSYIPCSANCRFQNEGLCGLNYASAAGTAASMAATSDAQKNDNGCLHYVPRNSVLKSAQFHGEHQRYSIPGSVSDL